MSLHTIKDPETPDKLLFTSSKEGSGSVSHFHSVRSAGKRFIIQILSLFRALLGNGSVDKRGMGGEHAFRSNTSSFHRIPGKKKKKNRLHQKEGHNTVRGIYKYFQPALLRLPQFSTDTFDVFDGKEPLLVQCKYEIMWWNLFDQKSG